jgi:UDP-N-acetyl-D-mannosaminuronate dehydrogenase
VIGLDIDRRRVAELREGHDRTNEVDPEALKASTLSKSWRARMRRSPIAWPTSTAA